MSTTRTFRVAAPMDPPVTSQARMVPSNGRAATPAVAVDGSEKSSRYVYLALLLFTFLLYARPTDYIRALAGLPLLQFTGLGAIALYGLTLVFGRLRLVISKETKIVAAITALFVIGIPVAYWRSNALDTVSDQWLKTMITFWLITQIAFTASRVRKIIWVILISIFVVGAVTYLNPQPWYYREGRLQGASFGFLSGNYLGPAVGSILPFMAVFLARSKSVWRSLFLFTVLGLSLLMVVQTASRSNLLLVLFGLGLSWTYLLRKNNRTRIMGIVIAVSIVLSVAAAPGIFWARVKTLWTGDVDNWATQSAAFSEEQRKGLFWRSVEYTVQHPLLGLGLGNFAIASGNNTGLAGEWKGTHNAYTQISSEAGIPALILYIALLLGTALRMRKLAKETERFYGRDPERGELHMMALATKAGIYVYMLAGLFAHIAYEFHCYYLIGIAICLQRHWDEIRGTEPELPPSAERSLRPWQRSSLKLSEHKT